MEMLQHSCEKLSKLTTIQAIWAKSHPKVKKKFQTKKIGGVVLVCVCVYVISFFSIVLFLISVGKTINEKIGTKKKTVYHLFSSLTLSLSLLFPLKKKRRDSCVWIYSRKLTNFYRTRINCGKECHMHVTTLNLSLSLYLSFYSSQRNPISEFVVRCDNT